MAFTATFKAWGARSKCRRLLVAVLLTGLYSAASAAQDSPARVPSMAQKSDGQGFQALRAIDGHFAGGSWNADVDRWNGKKHRIMQRLLAQVRQGEYRDTELIDLMGSPDRVWPESADEYPQLVQQTQWQGVAQGELWAYHWRGEHDQLLFALKAGRVVASGWLLGGE